jgi:hypothetical protein
MVRLAYVLNQPMFAGLLEHARPSKWWSGMLFCSRLAAGIGDVN